MDTTADTIKATTTAAINHDPTISPTAINTTSKKTTTPTNSSNNKTAADGPVSQPTKQTITRTTTITNPTTTSPHQAQVDPLKQIHTASPQIPAQ